LARRAVDRSVEILRRNREGARRPESRGKHDRAEYNIGGGDNKFVSEDADGNVKVSAVDPELLRIHSQESFAKEIGARILPFAAK
jgi:hypothetical protein